MLENETFKKISLEIYNSSVNKEDVMFCESYLTKSMIKEEEEEEKDIFSNEVICRFVIFDNFLLFLII